MSCGSCVTCYKVTPASVGTEGIYKQVLIEGERVWFTPDGDRLVSPADDTLIGELNAAAAESNQVDCASYAALFEPQPTDFEKAILCEADTNGDLTGVKVLAITTIDELGVPSTSYYNLATSASYSTPAGFSLVDCGGEVEYDLEPKPMCDNGTTTFLRWFQIQDGVLSGSVVDTEIDGTPYTPGGTVSFGACSAANEYQVSPACFRDPSAVGNSPIFGFKRITVNKDSGVISSVEWLDANGTTVLNQGVYVEIKCC
jgi:hypothetical protein